MRWLPVLSSVYPSFNTISKLRFSFGWRWRETFKAQSKLMLKPFSKTPIENQNRMESRKECFFSLLKARSVSKIKIAILGCGMLPRCWYSQVVDKVKVFFFVLFLFFKQKKTGGTTIAQCTYTALNSNLETPVAVYFVIFTLFWQSNWIVKYFKMKNTRVGRH